MPIAATTLPGAAPHQGARMPQWQVCPQSERSSVPRGRSGSSLHRHRVSQSLSMGAFLTRWPSRPKIYATNVRIPDNRDTRGRNAVVDSLRLRSCATYGLVARAIGRLHRCTNQIFSAGPRLSRKALQSSVMSRTSPGQSSRQAVLWTALRSGRG
jgi:hypothetical protein